MAHRYFLDEVRGETAYVRGEEANHLARVMRAAVGDSLTLTDKSGMDYCATITAITPGEITCKITSKAPNPAEPKKRLMVFMALPKGDKMEFICQKMCELGAVKLVPFVSEFCVAQKSKKEESKRVRLQKISDEACKQCGRSTPMEVGETLTFRQILPLLEKFDRTVLLYEEGSEPLKNIDFENCRTAALIIGSEGGFSPKEAEEMVKRGRKSVLLGRRILRCETAAVTGASLIMYRLGEMD